MSALSNHDFSKTFDMKSFTEELITLQNFYDLNTEQMALGIIQGICSFLKQSLLSMKKSFCNLAEVLF